MKTIPFADICRPTYPMGENIAQAIQYIDQAVPFIKDLIKDFPVHIWCSGSSGAILAALLAKSIDNHCVIFHVKKEGENSHCGNSFDKASEDRQAVSIIIDDFIRTGETISRIYAKAKDYYPFINILCVANAHKERWPLSFVPNNLIIERTSIHSSWRRLTPTRCQYNVEQQFH